MAGTNAGPDYANQRAEEFGRLLDVLYRKAEGLTLGEKEAIEHVFHVWGRPNTNPATTDPPKHLQPQPPQPPPQPLHPPDHGGYGRSVRRRYSPGYEGPPRRTT